MTEAEIQRGVFAEIRARGMPGVVAWAVPNNPMSRRTVGFRRGAHDVHALHRGKFYTVELKKDGGRPSEEQLEFRDDINNAGGFSVIAEGLPEAICILESWGLLRKAA